MYNFIKLYVKTYVKCLTLNQVTSVQKKYMMLYITLMKIISRESIYT